MKPIFHAQKSAKKYGGVAEDYIAIHDFIDSSKQCLADARHRALLHSTFGCFLVEKVFGHIITNSNGKKISTRDIAEDHISEDMGFIPTVEKWLKHMTLEPWMENGIRISKHTKTIINFVEKENTNV
jgi:hypothetical protein